MGALLDENASFDDQRPLIANPTRGRTAIVELSKTVAESGVVQGPFSVLATRGQRFVLVEHKLLGRDLGSAPFETVMLQVIELNEQGLIRLWVAIDPDALDEAFAVLDERYAASEPFALNLIDLGRQIMRAMNERDWSAYRRLLNDGLTLIDHRPASLGELTGADNQVNAVRELTEIVPGLRFYITAVHAIEGSRVLTHMSAKGKTGDGSDLDVSYLGLVEIDAVSLTRMELFGVEDLNAALARFDELSSDKAVVTIDNEAARVFRRFGAAFEAREWETFGALIDEDAVFDDRRLLVADPSRGREAIIEHTKTVADSGVLQVPVSVIATRGERLVLAETRLLGRDLGSGPFETVVLQLVAINEHGLISLWMTLDPEALDEAHAELESRHRLIEASEALTNEASRLSDRLNEGFRSRDWKALDTLLDDDVSFDDRRRGLRYTATGRRAFIELLKSAAESAGSFRTTTIATRGEHLVLRRMTATGESGRGGLETVFLSVQQWNPEGRLVRMVDFDPDDLEAALAELEALVERRPNLENVCARVVDKLDLTGAIGELMDLYAPDVVFDDRRSGLAIRLVGREALIEHMTLAFAVIESRERSILAIRGERLLLQRTLLRFVGGDDEIEALVLFRCNDTTEIDRIVMFDPSDLDEAYAELDERYAGGEGAAHTDVLAAICRLRLATNARDWDAARDALTDDAVVSDHRPVSLGELSPDAWVESVRAFAGVVDFRSDVVAIHRIEGDCALLQWNNAGHTADSDVVESPFQMLIRVRDGHVDRMEPFALDDLSLAQTRFDELVAASRAPEPSNTCTRTRDAWEQGFLRSDWDAAPRLIAEDIFHEDRRAGVQSVVRGREAFVESIQVVQDVYAGPVRFDTLATRGDRLALCILHHDVKKGFVVEFPLVLETNDQEQISVFIIHEDLDTALTDLDERYIAGEAAPYAQVWSSFVRALRALNDRDWVGFRREMADDYEFVDHRPASLGRFHGVDEQMASVQTLVEVIPDVHWCTTVVLRLDGHGGLVRTLITGSSQEGGAIEMAFLVLFVTRDGVSTRREFFPEDQLDAALARFDELGPSPTMPSVDNACVRVNRLLWERYEREDWNGIRELYTDDHVVEDRRAGVRATFSGADANIENLKAYFAVGGRTASITPVAVRGDRLALITHHITGPRGDSSFEGDDVLVLSELAEDGRISAGWAFDPDDLDRAFELLQERHIAGEGRPYEDILRFSASQVRAYNERDWGRFRATLRDDHVMADNRPAGGGTLRGPEEQIQYVQVLIGMAPDARLRISEILRCAPDRMLARRLVTGTTSDGAEIELAFLDVTQLRDGRQALIDVYPVDQLESALERYEEQVDDARGVLENLATRKGRAGSEALRALDWTTARSLLADDLVLDDRRQAVRSRAVGPDAWINNFRTMAELGMHAYLHDEVLAIRGDRLALALTSVSDADGNVIETLTLLEVNANGKTQRLVWFDPDDLEAAFAELEDTFGSNEGSSCAEIVRRNAKTIAAINERNWSEYMGSVADDFVMVDHRPASLGEVRIDGLVEAHKGLVELIPDLRVRLAMYHGLEPDRCVSQIAAVGHTEDGAAVDVSFINILVLVDGSVARTEFFPVDGLDAALLRFEELGHTTERITALDNAASRSFARARDAFAARDWEVFAELHAEDCRNVDRRRGLQNEYVGREAFVRHMQEMARLGEIHMEVTTIATRGDRVALASLVADMPELDVGAELLALMEVDAEGRITYSAQYDLGDVDTAFTELDERFFRSDEATDVARLGIESVRAYNARDWAGYLELLTDDFVFVEHKPAGRGVIKGGPAYVASSQGIVELVPDVRMRVPHVVREQGPLLLARTQSRGTDLYGNTIEFEVFALLRTRASRISSIEFFPLDALDDALARFDELDAPQMPAELANTASRVMGRGRGFEERGEWDRLADDTAENAVVEDRRAGFGWRIEGKDRVLDHVQVATHGAHVDAALVAIRGDRLALERQLVTSNDFEVELLVLCEVDEQDRLMFTALFDPDDVDGAFAELDERFARGEGAPYPDVLRAGNKAIEAINAHDWPALLACFTQDYVFVDHQPVGFGATLGPPQNWVTQIADLVPDVRMDVVADRKLSSDGGVFELRWSGHDRAGNPVEGRSIDIIMLRRGLIARREQYPTEELPRALARFEELTRHAAPSVPDNAAGRSMRLRIDHLNERRLEAFVSLHAPGWRGVDRRAGLAAEFAGHEGLRTHAQSIVGIRAEAEVLAVRGDRFALVRTHYTSPQRDGFEIDVLSVEQVGEDGLVTWSMSFDPDDLDAAFDELDKLYMAGEGAGATEIIAAGAELMRAMNTRDWPALRSLLTDEFVVADHRPVSLGEVRGAESWIQSLQALFGLMRTYRADVVRFHALGSAVALAEVRSEGVSSEGMRIDNPLYGVLARSGRRLSRLELFPVEDLARAVARFEELVAEASNRFENAAARVAKRTLDARLRGDWDEFLTLLAPDCRVEDRRPGLRTEHRGRERILEEVQGIASIGAGVIDFSCIATRGGRLALDRRVYRSADPDDAFQVTTLTVNEVDGDGRYMLGVVFDETDLDAAFEELEDRYVTGEGAPAADVLELSRAQRGALRTGDWGTYSSLIAEDVVLVDHRPAALGEVRGRDAVLDVLRALAPLIRDIRPIVRQVFAIAPDRTLVEASATGTSEHGGEVEVSHIRLQQWKDGAVVRIEMFPVDDLDTALLRFDELGARPHGAVELDNAACRAGNVSMNAIKAGDWATLRSLLREDVISDDRRRSVGSRAVGAEAYITNFRTLQDLGMRSPRNEILAIRGDNLALGRSAMLDADGNEIATLTLVDLAPDGLFQRFVWFDADDYDAAFEELDDRFLASDEATDLHRLGFELVAMYNARDWARFRELFTEDFVAVDHRLVGRGRLGADEHVASSQELIALVPNLRFMVTGVYREDPSLVLAGTRSLGTDHLGNAVDFEGLVLLRAAGSKISSLELFSSEAIDDAMARFDELAGHI